ncbi:MAG: DUF2142 domain-containing protein [Lachnospiraceae bacterium]|nr:DUF2142 domain-containing protein [Lachnospiraceae bacterium]
MWKTSKAKLISLVSISLIMLLWALLWPIGNKLVLGIAYADVANGTRIQAYRELNYEGFLEENSNTQRTDDGSAYFNLKWNHDDLTGIMIKPTNGKDAVLVNFLNIYLSHNMQDTPVCQVTSDQIMETFEIAGGEYGIDESGYLRITPSNEDCALVCTSTDLIDSIKSADASLKRQTKVGRFSSTLVILVILWFVVLNANEIMAFFEKQDTWAIVSIISLLVAGIGVWVIAFNSGISHPDEDDVIKCLNYGMKHFFPPDMRAEEVADTYSGYGYTKLANCTWYYLIAGKVAWLASKMWAGIRYYRVPNFLMFAGMAYLYIKNISKKRWLVLTLGICVQAWYIFSYTTADAMDFFLCFVVLLLLTNEEGILYKTVETKFELKGMWKHALLGVLFGFICLGKPNYLAILALAFIVLLFKLLETPKEERRTLWVNYWIIIGFFLVTVVTRAAFDIYHYGMNYSEVKAEMDALHAAYDKNPTTPVQDIAVTYRMAKYGHSLPELFMAAPTWFKSTFRSFCGLNSDVTTKDVYFKLMGILYGVVGAALAYLSGKNVSDKTKAQKIKLGVLFGLFVISFVASIVNSYVSDSQPQGRYLLPMLFTASYIAYLTPEVFEKKYFKAAVISLQVLSAWYFVTAGVGCFL